MEKIGSYFDFEAGNGLLDGILEVIPTTRVGFVGMYRDEETLEPIEYYCKVPAELENRLVIAVDPMLATGVLPWLRSIV